MPTYFNKNLPYVRKQKKMTQVELADKIGVDQSTISLWEKGMDLTVENAFKVANALDIPIPEFLGKDLQKNNNSYDELQNEYDKEIEKIALELGGEIYIDKKAPLTANDVVEINKILMELIKDQDKNKNSRD